MNIFSTFLKFMESFESLNIQKISKYCTKIYEKFKEKENLLI